MGVTQEWYEEKAASQNNKCAICEKDEGYDGYRFGVDHDHNCCKAEAACENCRRDLLCRSCNLMIGSAFDSSNILKAGAAYLRKYAEAKNEIEHE